MISMANDQKMGAAMQAQIVNKLNHIAATRQVRWLWAVESGSRAWGFASPDSDYDVRGVYVQAPTAYMGIDAASENFEWIENTWFDVGAWDVRKTLRLLRTSNATVLEWLQSPHIYQAAPDFQETMWALAQAYFQPAHALYHYRGIAKTASSAVQADGSIRLKKWFYVLRPLLAALWVVQHQGIAPMTLGELLVTQPAAIQAEVLALVALKQQKSEDFVFVPTPNLSQWVVSLWQQTDSKLLKKTVPDGGDLDQLFQTWVGRYAELG